MAKKKTVASTGLNAFYDEVSRHADTAGLEITVAETKRVIACFFDELSKLPADEAIDIIAKGLKRAKAREA